MPKPPEARRSPSTHPATRTLAFLGAGALVLYGSRVLLDFFGRGAAFTVDPLDVPLDSEEFVQFLTIVTDGTLRHSRITRLKNGAEFYPAQLAAIRRAQHAIDLEGYEFLEGEVAASMLDALTERALAGVRVRLIVDRIGSLSTHTAYFDRLRSAGGQVLWYHPLRWNTWQHLNQRTHRKLLIVDGQTGFIGGAGIGDQWLRPTKLGPTWRDTVFCVEGEAVAGLISTFSENWLECSGEILSGAAQFAFRSMPGGAPSFVVPSTPQGGGTKARILFQSLIASARESIRITTPYFLPDRSARAALAEAVRQRGVRVQILTAGPRIDHPIVRGLSLQSCRHLLEAGAEIFDYQPAMIHAKTMTVDGQWSIVGSTNFDHRSFALNDEVNLAVLDPALAATIDRDLDDDLTRSCPVQLSDIKRQLLLGSLPRALLHALDWGS